MLRRHSSAKHRLNSRKWRRPTNTTPEYKRLIAADKKCRDSSVAFQTFDTLLHIVNIFGAVYTAPLRFMITHLGAELLNITKIEIKGY